MKVQSYSRTTNFTASGGDLHMRKPFHWWVIYIGSKHPRPSKLGQYIYSSMPNIYRYSYGPMDWNGLNVSWMVVQFSLFKSRPPAVLLTICNVISCFGLVIVLFSCDISFVVSFTFFRRICDIMFWHFVVPFSVIWGNYTIWRQVTFVYLWSFSRNLVLSANSIILSIDFLRFDVNNWFIFIVCLKNICLLILLKCLHLYNMWMEVSRQFDSHNGSLCFVSSVQ